ncbi:hypothetical protein FOXB_01064 [Fusarium oxysporum f. sp. conglutinans Fo5176]|uniref:Uncharacterized protein n=1 Tax=Fusarium oxysporum (strain Fo5176) TaxID=660025 RepID=F9F3T9_FUSOF|nr:hypothetical protein FOXB_01064 [Fusarium oxysporum f. sp. conglutinans Fo5176]
MRWSYPQDLHNRRFFHPLVVVFPRVNRIRKR